MNCSTIATICATAFESWLRTAEKSALGVFAAMATAIASFRARMAWFAVKRPSLKAVCAAAWFAAGMAA